MTLPDLGYDELGMCRDDKNMTPSSCKPLYIGMVILTDFHYNKIAEVDYATGLALSRVWRPDCDLYIVCGGKYITQMLSSAINYVIELCYRDMLSGICYQICIRNISRKYYRVCYIHAI